MYLTLIAAANVGKDPEMKYLDSGTAVTEFSAATNKQYKNSAGETVKTTTWLRVTVYGKMAEVVNQYVKKGSKVLIEGELRPDPTTGGPRVYKKQDGSHGASYEVTAQTVRFLSSRDEQTTGGDAAPFVDDDGGVPF